MSFVDAIFDRKTDKIHIVERVDGERKLLELPAQHVFYYEDPAGHHRSIFGHTCRKFTSPSGQKFRSVLLEYKRRNRRIFESDINPIFRCLADNYMGSESPVLNIGFFDIEADFHPEKGFAPTDDPFNAVTAITLYRSYDMKLITWALCPPTMALDEARKAVEGFADTFVYRDERTLLEGFLEAIDDVDVITGWNSNGYDVPYLVNRVSRVISKSATKKFCLWNQLPAKREYTNKFGRMVTTYDFVGRVHLDYLELYAKHVQQQRLSYALNAIGEIEVGDTKTPYEGTLDDLYKKDFRNFIEYNRQDVMLMVKIDQKNKFIELANQIAHANCVLLKTTMGSVALIEQAIINEMHAMGRIVPDRRPRDDKADPQDYHDPGEDEERAPVVGAYVAQPKKGLHEHIGAVDINSLYPSTIRALNMSPETLVGQVRPIETDKLIAERVAKLSATQRAEAWEGLFSTVEVQHMHDRSDDMLTVDFFDNITGRVKTREMTGRELHDYVFDDQNGVCITANGTLFRTRDASGVIVEGMIPALLGKWYADRKSFQRQMKIWSEKALGVAISPQFASKLVSQPKPQNDRDIESKDYDLDELKRLVSDADEILLTQFMTAHDLRLDGGKIQPLNSELFRNKGDHFNFQQISAKLRLNSLYGALLQNGCRFYDERVGQSTTLTGRSIARHMHSQINKEITGEYTHLDGALIYGDTDSSIFSAYEFLKDDARYAGFQWTRENIIDLYDMIADEVNSTFADFMGEHFHTEPERGGNIKAGREYVASKGLFIKKKKHAVLIYDLEGKRLDVDGKPGKLKPMGLDLKRSDTPKFMQKFLESLLIDLLTGADKEQMYGNIRDFRQAFKQRPGWEKGAPKKVANLSAFGEKVKKADNTSLTTKVHEPLKVNMPGHVLASLNWNKLCDIYKDRHAVRITDSARIIVCKLLNNSYGMTSIAYPIDETHLPEWFQELPFDHAAMEETIIDNKLDNLVGVLEWDLTDTKDKGGDEFFSF